MGLVAGSFREPAPGAPQATTCVKMKGPNGQSTMSPEAARRHLLAARGKTVPGLAWVQTLVPRFVKAALDDGAGGIIVPQIRATEEVRQVVAVCRYRPAGSRGYDPRVPSIARRRGQSSRRPSSQPHSQAGSVSDRVPAIVGLAQPVGTVTTVLNAP